MRFKSGLSLTLATALIVVGASPALAQMSAPNAAAPEAPKAKPAAPLVSLTPYPAKITKEQGAFALTAATPIYVPKGDAEAMSVAVWLQAQLKTSRGLTLKIHEGAAPDATKAISFVRQVFIVAPPSESYTLSVAPRGVTLAASDRTGLFYAAVSLSQLALTPGSLQALSIQDQPRFAWRGLMIDSARHFQSIDEIKNIIDGMAIYKLNVLHWHLVDDQGWRLEIKAYPKLTEVGAWRSEAGREGIDAKGNPIRYGGFYTQDQVRDVIAYAAARNITIVPEIEMPGHALAPIMAYPELGSQKAPPTDKMWDWGIYPYLYNVDDKTFDFINTVLDEVIALFPSPYIHVGGDEAIKDQWKASPEIQAKIKELGLKSEDELQSWFITRVGKHISAKGRRLIGWDEILLGGLAPDATVMSWRGTEGAIKAAELGHDTVLSPWPIMYLDNRQSPSSDEPPGRGRVVSLKDVYQFDPTPDAIPEKDVKHILGLQANVWTEHIKNDGRLEAMAFPRIVAVAEIGWSPEAGLDWDGFADRLPVTLKGLDHAKISYNRVPFEPHITVDEARTPEGLLKLEVFNSLNVGEIRYSLKAKTPLATAPIYKGPLKLYPGAKLRAQTFLEGRPLGREKTFVLSPEFLETRDSFALHACGEALPIGRENDSSDPAKRGLMMVDVMKPCWLWKGADLTKGVNLTVSVGETPFNFQLAEGAAHVPWPPAASKNGELEIRRDDCVKGDVLKTVSLPDGEIDGFVTVKTELAALEGKHDLCFHFTAPNKKVQRAIDRIRLTPKAMKP